MEVKESEQLDEKTLEEWRRNADGFGLVRELQLIDSLRATRQELAATKLVLASARIGEAESNKRIAELEQELACMTAEHDRERIAELEELWRDFLIAFDGKFEEAAHGVLKRVRAALAKEPSDASKV